MNAKYWLLLTLITLIAVYSSSAFSSNDVKCDVCKVTVLEMLAAVDKVDPNKKADTGTFRLDADGNAISKTVRLVKSEMYLTELMENICDKMEDYLKATYKTSGKFTLIKMMVDGKMNPETSNVDFVQDGDLNKSLGHFCLEILEDHEEVFLKSFQAETLADDLDIKICSELANYCKHAPIQEDYNFDEKEEL